MSPIESAPPLWQNLLLLLESQSQVCRLLGWTRRAKWLLVQRNHNKQLTPLLGPRPPAGPVSFELTVTPVFTAFGGICLCLPDNKWLFAFDFMHYYYQITACCCILQWSLPYGHFVSLKIITWSIQHCLQPWSINYFFIVVSLCYILCNKWICDFYEYLDYLPYISVSLDEIEIDLILFLFYAALQLHWLVQ